MSVSHPQAAVCPRSIDCGERARVCLSFCAETETMKVPADMVLVLDRSGSMCGKPLVQMKLAAKCLLRQVARASGDETGRQLLGGSRMGLVAFSTEAQVMVPPETRLEPLDGAVDALEACGDTNHEKAFRRAGELLARSRSDRRIVILFTDGVSNLGDADPAALALREAGIEIYCIGLLQSACLLQNWASRPLQTHVAVTGEPENLRRIFSEIASEVVRCGIHGAVLRGRLREDFRIAHMELPSHGRVEVSGGRSFCWEIGSLCSSGPVSLCLEVRHVGQEGGLLPIFESICYQDLEGNPLCFENPELQVDCSGSAVVVEPCPCPTEVTAGPCQDTACGRLCSITLDGLGRILEVSALIRNVCPGKRVAAAVVLTELDSQGNEHPRGTKMFTIPPQTGEGCRDVVLRCIRFVVPESARAEGPGDSLCGQRHFEVRVFANYLDTDYLCCDSETELHE